MRVPTRTVDATLIGVVCSARLFVFGAVDYGQLGEAAGIAAARNESRKSNRVIPQRAVDHRVDIAPTFAPSIASISESFPFIVAMAVALNFGFSKGKHSIATRTRRADQPRCYALPPNQRLRTKKQLAYD